MRPIRQGRLRRLKREADDLARKRNKGPADRARESDINAQFERDMRQQDTGSPEYKPGNE